LKKVDSAPTSADGPTGARFAGMRPMGRLRNPDIKARLGDSELGGCGASRATAPTDLRHSASGRTGTDAGY
jgi:hypothetical protein